MNLLGQSMMIILKLELNGQRSIVICLLELRANMQKWDLQIQERIEVSNSTLQKQTN